MPNSKVSNSTDVDNMIQPMRLSGLRTLVSTTTRIQSVVFLRMSPFMDVEDSVHTLSKLKMFKSTIMYFSGLVNSWFMSRKLTESINSPTISSLELEKEIKLAECLTKLSW